VLGSRFYEGELMMSQLFLTLALAVAFVSQQSLAAVVKVDESHTDIGFTITHLVVSKVNGRFNKFDGAFNFDPKKSTFSDFNVTVDAASIDTKDAKRDTHLKSEDFFDVSKFPTITFKSTKVEGKGKKGKVHGDLTMRGVTKPVVLDYTYNGQVTDPWGNQKLGIELSGKVNRKEFGLNWNKTLDKGGVAVGEDVMIKVAVEGDIQAEKPKGK
jgi:polyisoprenoid-binding protein YceI